MIAFAGNRPTPRIVAALGSVAAMCIEDFDGLASVDDVDSEQLADLEEVIALLHALIAWGEADAR